MVDREAAVGDGLAQRDSCVAAEIEGAGLQGPEATPSASAAPSQSWSGRWRYGSLWEALPRRGLSPRGKLGVGQWESWDMHSSLDPLGMYGSGTSVGLCSCALWCSLLCWNSAYLPVGSGYLP